MNNFLENAWIKDGLNGYKLRVTQTHIADNLTKSLTFKLINGTDLPPKQNNGCRFCINKLLCLKQT